MTVAESSTADDVREAFDAVAELVDGELADRLDELEDALDRLPPGAMPSRDRKLRRRHVLAWAVRNRVRKYGRIGL